MGNDTLTFYIGLIRINQIKQWQSNVNQKICFVLLNKIRINLGD